MADPKHPLTANFPAGLSQPAIRALANAGCRTLDDVARRSELEIKNLHGMGPRGVEILRQALAEKGLAFAGQQDQREAGHA